MSDYIKITVLNFFKEKPKTSKGKFHWFKFDHDFFNQGFCSQLHPKEVSFYLYILCEASRSFTRGSFILNKEDLNKNQLKISEEYLDILDKFNQLSLIEYEILNNRPASTDAYQRKDKNKNENERICTFNKTICQSKNDLSSSFHSDDGSHFFNFNEINEKNLINDTAINWSINNQNNQSSSRCSEDLNTNKSSSRYSEDLCEEFLTLWNDNCGKLTPCKKLTPKRSKLIMRAYNQAAQKEYWIDLIRRLAASAFHNGQNSRGWIANIDFLIQPDKHVELDESLTNREPRIIFFNNDIDEHDANESY